MTTAAALRTRVYEYLYGAYPTDRPFEDWLTSSITNATTTVPVSDGTLWAVRDIGELETTGERFLVTAIASNDLTVKRSYGSVAATASSGSDDLIRKNPRFTQDQVDSALTDALNVLEAWGIHGFNTGSITITTDYYYSLTSVTDIAKPWGVLSVHYADTSYAYPVQLPFTFMDNLGITTSSGIVLRSNGDLATGDTAYYTYAQRYQFDTDLDTTAAKLLPEHEELVVLSAVARIMGATIAPATMDPGARTDRTIQPGQTGRDGRWFQGEFFIKVRAEAARLAVERKRTTDNSDIHTARSGRWKA